jgi:hypothetical protein
MSSTELIESSDISDFSELLDDTGLSANFDFFEAIVNLIVSCF